MKIRKNDDLLGLAAVDILSSSKPKVVELFCVRGMTSQRFGLHRIIEGSD